MARDDYQKDHLRTITCDSQDVAGKPVLVFKGNDWNALDEAVHNRTPIALQQKNGPTVYITSDTEFDKLAEQMRG